MTHRARIASTTNDRIKALRRLARRSVRGAPTVLVEGHRQLRCALEAGAAVREVYSAPALHLGSGDAALVDLAERRGALVLELEPAVFRAVFRLARPDGLAALVERRASRLDEALAGACPLLLVAEGVERPGNLGTIVRSACAAGASGVLVCDAVTNAFHPDVVRGSVGTLFHVPVLECTTAEAVSFLRRRLVQLVVATPDGCRPFWTVDYSRPTAVVVGGERYGVNDAWFAAADETVSIPMPGRADSLNVAVAAAVLLFEAARQRLGAAP